MNKTILKNSLLGMVLAIPAIQANADCTQDRICMSDRDCAYQCLAGIQSEPVTDVGATCTDTPSVTITDFPSEFKPSGKGGEASLIIGGTISTDTACTLSKTWYELEDEYNENSHSDSVTVDSDGNYEIQIPIVASRKGDDTDGRDYRFTVFADNEAGTGASRTFKATVKHDNRKN